MRIVSPLQPAILALIAFGCLLFLGISSFAAPYPASRQQLIATITSLLTARNTIIAQRQEAGSNRIDLESSREDFATFISYLDGRIYFYCEKLAEGGGIFALQDSGCPLDPSGNLAPSHYGSVPSSEYQTDKEKLAALDDEFTQSLGTFDEMLLEEQDKVASHIPKKRESDSGLDPLRSEMAEGPEEGRGKSDNRSMYPSGQPQETDSYETGQEIPAAGSSQNRSRGTGTGSTQESKLPPTSGNKELSRTDDDVIARQLREAAEQETDPEVKEKLWEEYRKYKEGIQ